MLRQGWSSFARNAARTFSRPERKNWRLTAREPAGAAGDMDFTYFNATYTVENALSKIRDEKGMKRVEKFLKQSVCPECGGTRLSDAARAPRLRGISLAEACKMTLSELIGWVKGVPASLPEEMRPMAENICESFLDVSKRLTDLGLSYLTLDRAASTLSTGEHYGTLSLTCFRMINLMTAALSPCPYMKTALICALKGLIR